MRLKFLRDVLVQGATHSLGSIHQINDMDKVHSTEVEMCTGHGSFCHLTIGVDVELLEDDISRNEYETALRVFHEYSKDAYQIKPQGSVRSPFTIWCENQLKKL